MTAAALRAEQDLRNRMAETPNLHWKALLRDYRMTKPLIAAVEGYAVAGGTEMLQGTDIRIAGETATFGVWEAKRGLFPLAPGAPPCSRRSASSRWSAPWPSRSGSDGRPAPSAWSRRR